MLGQPAIIRMALRVFLALMLLGLGGMQPAATQDSNYWTNQYGNQARLLGGLVVGSSDDVASVFYNPGRLALTENTALVLAGNVVRFTNISLENALGEGLDLSSTKLAGVPSLFAGELRLGFLNEHRLAYSFLTRYDFALRFEQRGDLTSLTEDRFDLLTASIDLDETMSEYWAGLTWAMPMGEKIGLGVTGFGLFRDQRSRAQTLVEAQVDTLSGVALQRDDFDYLYVGLLGKVGLGANLDNWKLGLSVTTPNVKLYGSGAFGVDQVLITQDLDGDGNSSSLIITDYQDGLSAHYHSPLSAALGVSYVWKKNTNLEFTSEWFNVVDYYRVLDTQPIAGPDTVISANIGDQRKSVINFGFGVDHSFNPKLRGYTSFRTDYSSAMTLPGTNATISTWDIYHLAAGLTFPAGASEFTFGGIYAFGSDKRDEGIDVIPDSGEGDDVMLPQELTAKFRRLTFILGFSIDF
jgi:hypothetical protein